MCIYAKDLLQAMLAGVTVVGLGGCSGTRPPPNLEPEEQVSIGYDRVRAEDVTGSVGSLSSDDLELMRFNSIEELIRDRIPGVHVTMLPSGDYSFRIRGTRSLIGNNEPLVVINGMPLAPQSMSSALAGIVPADVLRIDVLKDAGSTAAFGSRGANGVIVITTKSANLR